MTFRAPDLKKAIKVAQDMGLIVVGYEIGRDGSFRVDTAVVAKDAADAALAGWEKTHGKNA